MISIYIHIDTHHNSNKGTPPSPPKRSLHHQKKLNLITMPTPTIQQ